MSGYQYLSSKQIVESDCYPFSDGQLRHFFSKRHKNGLEKAVRKVGRRLYLRQDLFEEWIESQTEHSGGRQR